jgi:hypothetical protein
MRQWTVRTKGRAMLSWLRRRRERAERIDARAKALIRAFGVDAYYEARQRHRQAASAQAAQEWRCCGGDRTQYGKGDIILDME